MSSLLLSVWGIWDLLILATGALLGSPSLVLSRWGIRADGHHHQGQCLLWERSLCSQEPPHRDLLPKVFPSLVKPEIQPVAITKVKGFGHRFVFCPPISNHPICSNYQACTVLPMFTVDKNWKFRLLNHRKDLS